MSLPEMLSPASTPRVRNAISRDSNLSSVNTSASASNYSDKFTRVQVEALLKTQPDRYIIIENTGKHSSDCWTSFGFSAIINGNGAPQQIEGFASCRKCFSTYSYASNSTRWLNQHDCQASKERRTRLDSKGTPSSQRRLTAFYSAKAVTLKQSEIMAIKDLQAEWVCQSVRPFSIVEDNGLRRLIQECISIGKSLIEESEQAANIVSFKVPVTDTSMLIKFYEEPIQLLLMSQNLPINIGFVLAQS